jgi:hypothetical protein
MMVGMKVWQTTFDGMGMMPRPTINLTGWLPITSRHALGSRLSPFLHLLITLGWLCAACHLTLQLWVMTSSSLRTWFPLSSVPSLLLTCIALSWGTWVLPTICYQPARPSFRTSWYGTFAFAWATTLALPSLGGGQQSFPLMGSAS